MKSISIILVLALMYFSIACHTLNIISHSDEIRQNLESGEEVYIMTDDSTKYNFNDPYTYKLTNDTLHGYGEKLIGDNMASYGAVALNIEHISYLENDKYDGGKTAVIFILLGGIWMVGFSSGGKDITMQ